MTRHVLKATAQPLFVLAAAQRRGHVVARRSDIRTRLLMTVQTGHPWAGPRSLMVWPMGQPPD